MANTVLSTARTTPVTLASGDNYHIAPSGSITLTSGSAAAINNATTESGIDVGIEGRTVSLVSPAIELARASETDFGGYAVSIAASGAIYADCGFDETAVHLVGRASAVTNFGAITSTGAGIRIEGSESVVRNFGTVAADASGIGMVGDFSRLINGGTVTGVNCVSVAGDNISIENSGRIEVSPFLNGLGVGAVNISGFANARFVNTGVVNGFEVIGLRLASVLSGAVMQVENLGIIASSTNAIAGSMGAGTVLSLVKAVPSRAVPSVWCWA